MENEEARREGDSRPKQSHDRGGEHDGFSVTRQAPGPGALPYISQNKPDQ